MPMQLIYGVQLSMMISLQLYEPFLASVSIVRLIMTSG